MAGFPSPVRVGELVADRYRVEGVLGRGGMGVVLAARHVGHGGQVALKVLRPSDEKSNGRSDVVRAQRLRREARTAARLRGEHVARVLDVGALPSGEPFLVLERLHGHDLATEIERGRLTVERVETLAFELCTALAESHAAGVTHRDIKPSNLFLVERPGALPLLKVLDFGMAKVSSPNEEGMTLTADDTAMGSAPYMSPEQIRDAKHVDGRADLWSIGIVLYECLTGVRPFDRTNSAATIAAILSDAPRPLASLRPDVSHELSRIILRCLEKEREERWPTVLELAEAMATLSGGRGVDALNKVYSAQAMGAASFAIEPRAGCLESESTLDPFSFEENGTPRLDDIESPGRYEGRTSRSSPDAAVSAVVSSSSSLSFASELRGPTRVSNANKSRPVMLTAGLGFVVIAGLGVSLGARHPSIAVSSASAGTVSSNDDPMRTNVAPSAAVSSANMVENEGSSAGSATASASVRHDALRRSPTLSSWQSAPPVVPTKSIEKKPTSSRPDDRSW